MDFITPHSLALNGKKWFNRLNNDNNYSIIGLVFLLCKNRWLQIHQEIVKIQYTKLKQTFFEIQRTTNETESQWLTQHDPQWIFKSFKILSVLLYFDEMNQKSSLHVYTCLLFDFHGIDYLFLKSQNQHVLFVFSEVFAIDFFCSKKILILFWMNRFCEMRQISHIK